MSLLSVLPAGLSWPSYIGMSGMVLIGACLQGVGGLGFAMFCAPIAVLLFPELVPGPLLVLSFPLALMAALREHVHIQWAVAGAAIAGRVLGTLLAAACLVLLPVSTLSVLFACLILTGVALSVMGWRVTPSAPVTAIAGMASGLMGTITSSGGPPFAIAMQSLAPASMRATLGCVFFVGSAISLAALAGVGQMGWPQLVLSLLLMPWMVVGFMLSGVLARHLSHEFSRRFLLGMATVAALAVLFRVLA
ncbi:sulfite exporter TauE/SafE family protein [soil metagenome]